MGSAELGRFDSAFNILHMPDVTSIDLALSKKSAIDQITQAVVEDAPYLAKDSQPLNIVIYPEISSQYITTTDMKDADLLNFDGTNNIYLSVGTVRGIPNVAFHETWQVGRLKQRIDGTYELMPPVTFEGGDLWRPCAPAVMKDSINGEERVIMILHQDCFTTGGAIQAFESYNGQNFNFIGTLIEGEEGIGKYDPEISEIDGRKVVTYVRYVGTPNTNEIHAAEIIPDGSGKFITKELGAILRPQDLVAIHNQPDEEDVEWGMEAARMQKVKFPDGTDKIITTLVTFQKAKDSSGKMRERETRQRFTFAVSNAIGEKPYWVGYLATPQGVGENGHGIWTGEEAVYQERLKGGGWGLRIAKVNPQALFEASSASMGLAA